MPSKKPAKAQPKPESRLSRGRTRDDARFTAAPSFAGLPESYAATLQEIKSHLRSARVRAVLAANPIVLEAYWHTGKIILQRQKKSAWGAKVIDRLASDLRDTFPDMSGLSARNLLAMKIFAREFPDGPIAQQPVAQLPWGHVLQLMQRLKDPAARDFYIQQTLTHGWSRSILELQIQNQLHLRAGKAVNNFALTMPPAESDMAAQLFKDPYLFDFIGTADPRRRLEETNHRDLAGRVPGQPADHRGDRGRTGRDAKNATNWGGTTLKPFEKKMPRLVAELHAQFAESAKLEKIIRANLAGRRSVQREGGRGLGYGR